MLVLVLFSEDGNIKSLLERAKDNLLGEKRPMVLTESHTGIRLCSCLLGTQPPGRESVCVGGAVSARLGLMKIPISCVGLQ